MNTNITTYNKTPLAQGGSHPSLPQILKSSNPKSQKSNPKSQILKSSKVKSSNPQKSNPQPPKVKSSNPQKSNPQPPKVKSSNPQNPNPQNPNPQNKKNKSSKQKKQILTTLILILSLTLNKQYAQTLDTLLYLTVENNPQLKTLNLEYEAELTKVNQVNQLPNPEAGVGLPILRPETRLGGQVLMVSASQMFPWFGTLKAKEDVVVAISKVKYERITALKLGLFNQVKVAYYQLVFLNEKIDIIKEYIALYKTLESVSLAKVESGQSNASDVLRIQLKLQELEQELNIIENQKKKFNAQINRLIHQPLETEITVKRNENQKTELKYNLEEFKQNIKNNHPLMQRINQQIEVSKQKQILNKNKNKPSFGIGLDYSVVNARTDASPINNGQDILIPKVKMSIPIYRKSYRAKDKEEQLTQESLAYQKETLEDKMLSRIIQNKVRFDEAKLKEELYQNQIKTTQMAYEILLSNYSSTGKGFDELLQIQNQLLNYKLALKKEKLNQQITIANIQRLTNI